MAAICTQNPPLRQLNLGTGGFSQRYALDGSNLHSKPAPTVRAGLAKDTRLTAAICTQNPPLR
ncbi:hypothetical protein [Scytonema millei]|uniref:Uncharacterized protein n=1 Tax=Scytonema millei VB511283 TaxID=1245923 RepID=A0A9X5E6Z7_9CYAN|nr:hypothetical protein [Scytonema millei]NHC36083.1 hypothetical protein [Scytonema millei VB511283]